ncbi:MAG: beta-galactosidase, partial [Candidatus Cyclobacteriaceae bacterium M3_2C_046]
NWNLLRKYANLQNWREMTYQRLQSWGINTIGNWAEKEVITDSPVPFTYSFESEFGRYKKDVFDPKWIAYVDSVISEAAEFKENPYLLGYFVDNESGWGNLDLLKTLPENAHLRQEWLKYLQSKYKQIKAANQQWKGSFDNWQQAMNNHDETLIDVKDVQELEKMYARQYFEVITSTLRKYDNNHLYLGCRFTRKLKPLHLLKIAGQYCDVVTVNVYSYEPDEGQMSAWHSATGRPLLIGEHHAALKGERQLPLRWQVFDEKERYDYLTNYISTWALQPYSLGSHWYQYSDQHLTGRSSNGENQIVGMVDITDQPHQELIRAVRDVSKKVYEMHFKQNNNDRKAMPGSI